MLTFRDPFSGANMPIAVAGGDMIGIAFVLPADAGPFTNARVLVVGDLIRRVFEDVGSAQVLAAVIASDRAAADAAWRPGLMVRPVIGVFTTSAGAEVGLGKPLDLMITVAGSGDEPTMRLPAVHVAPVHAALPYPGADPATVRFAVACTPHAQQLKVTSSLLAHSQATLERWRGRVDEWSHHPSRPIPPAWRAAAIAALDDNLDVTRVVEMMSELEGAEGVEPGAKFEAFAYLDRVLAVDLSRDLGRTRH
jgi:hypothetical protein